MTKLVSTAIITTMFLFAIAAEAGCREQRSAAYAGARAYAEHLEQFDTVLHEQGADAELTHWVHHFEEGFNDFVDVFERSTSCRDVVEEFQHFHEDVQELYQQMSRRPQLFYRPVVLQSWNKLVVDFVRVQNNLY